MKNGLFIFRRDFRIIDNKGLLFLDNECDKIYTIFIFTPEQVSNNNFKSENCIQFMIESLMDLEKEIKKNEGELLCFYGDNNKIIEYLINELDIKIICSNKDYTPYSIERSNRINKLCSKYNIEYHETKDYYLNEPDTIVNSQNTPYKKFTPYYDEVKNKIKFTIESKPKKLDKISKKLKYSIKLNIALNKFTTINDNIYIHGGRKEGIERLKKSKNITNRYEETRNLLNKETTGLSAYIKFGCISIREVYKELTGKIRKQLIWRDFYMNILYNYPHVLENPMKENYSKIKWNEDRKIFNLWKNGKTGYPIVDAGITQLNTTGYMHNRARLIVGCFLVKILLINWQWGEKYFATKLVDYDPASNNGNWQWISGSGTDSQPYFRIFNPWNQSKTYDNNCEYIKKWIPELRDIPNDHIHNWYKYSKEYKIEYPSPIVDYVTQRDKMMKLYKVIK